MYLHCYMHNKYVGAVDIEVYFTISKKERVNLIACEPDHDLLLGSLELVYGKAIKRMDANEAYENMYKSGHIHQMNFNKYTFTTKKCGKELTWDHKDRMLCV